MTGPLKVLSYYTVRTRVAELNDSAVDESLVNVCVIGEVISSLYKPSPVDVPSQIGSGVTTEPEPMEARFAPFPVNASS